MVLPILSLAGASFVLSWVLTLTMKHLAPRIGFVDKPGHRKIHVNPKPLGGGVAIFWGIAGPMLVLLAVLNFAGHLITKYYDGSQYVQDLVEGGQHQTPMSLGFLGGMLVLRSWRLLARFNPKAYRSYFLFTIQYLGFLLLGLMADRLLRHQMPVLPF